MINHSARIDFSQFKSTAPEVYAAMTALSKAVKDSGLEPALVELVKIRASQINGCVYCKQFHLKLAEELGIQSCKTDNLTVWVESDVYTDRERAALTWTEMLTNMASNGISNQDFADVKSQFSEKEIIFLTVSIATINCWNRIAEALLFTA